jgi:5'-nucleotidase
MLVLLDMDGVLADFETGFLNHWLRLHPEKGHVPIAERKSFYIDDDYPEAHRSFVGSIFERERFYAELPPIAGAIAGLRAMQAAGHEVRICTSPLTAYRYCVPEKYEWVERHIGADFIPNVMITKDKTLVAGDVLVDDRPEVKGWRKPDWVHVLYDQPYNRERNAPRMTWGNWRETLASLPTAGSSAAR